jgi:hypothetical protein
MQWLSRTQQHGGNTETCYSLTDHFWHIVVRPCSFIDHLRTARTVRSAATNLLTGGVIYNSIREFRVEARRMRVSSPSLDPRLRRRSSANMNAALRAVLSLWDEMCPCKAGQTCDIPAQWTRIIGLIRSAHGASCLPNESPFSRIALEHFTAATCNTAPAGCGRFLGLIDWTISWPGSKQVGSYSLCFARLLRLAFLTWADRGVNYSRDCSRRSLAGHLHHCAFNIH